jgi:hypothetical protein
MNESIIETELDCPNEIARLFVSLVPHDFSLAAIDVVREDENVALFRAFYLIDPEGEKFSVKLPYELKNLLRQLAHLSSTDERGLYKKLRFALKNAENAVTFKLNYDYDDVSPGFIGSNGVLVDGEFFNRLGPH